MSEQRPLRVLLVEDHPADVALTRKAFARIATANALDVVPDGIEAMRFLRRQGPYTTAERPDIILLDLNMPRMTGCEVLEEIRQDDGLKAIPVIVLTTSGAVQDVREAYELGANAYLTKPVGFDAFLNVVEAVEAFWFGLTLLPTPP